MLFSYQWIKEYLGKKAPTPKKAADLLMMHAFEIEKVTKKGTDTILDIAVLTNRGADCMSHLGMARELGAILNIPVKAPAIGKEQKATGSVKKIKVEIQALDAVPRYMALVIEGVEVKASPAEIGKRLEAVGMNSINNVVDVTNYVMQELGQPLHAFNADAIRGGLMRVRYAKKGETVRTLEGEDHGLEEGMLVIEDTERIIDLAGIKGGEVSSITKDTSSIVLQAACFDSSVIYRTMRRMGYSTQASKIYASGVDPNLAEEGLKRAAALIQKYAGGKVAQAIDIYPKKEKSRLISLDFSYVERLLGCSIPRTEGKRILERLGCTVQGRTEAMWGVIVPTRRKDLQTQEDLAEEIGRIWGYEKIAPVMPFGSLAAPDPENTMKWRELARDAFAAAGFSEAYTYSFVGDQELHAFAYTGNDAALLAEVANPVSEDLRYMRSSLLDRLLRSSVSQEHPGANVRIFETGKVFEKSGKGFKEKWVVAGVVKTKDSKGFYEAKGVLDFVASRLGISDVWYNEHEVETETRGAIWHQGKIAEVKIGERHIGLLGEISSRVTSHLKTKERVTAFEMDLDALCKEATEERAYEAPSRFPSSIRDISILVPETTRVKEVLEVIQATGGDLVEDVDVFDLYEGKDMEGMKSMAFHIIYQSDDRTLEGKEVDALHASIETALKNTNPKWTIR